MFMYFQDPVNILQEEGHSKMLGKSFVSFQSIHKLLSVDDCFEGSSTSANYLHIVFLDLRHENRI